MRGYCLPTVEGTKRMSGTESFDEAEMLARREETYGGFLRVSVYSIVLIAIALGLMALFLT